MSYDQFQGEEDFHIYVDYKKFFGTEWIDYAMEVGDETPNILLFPARYDYYDRIKNQIQKYDKSVPGWIIEGFYYLISLITDFQTEKYEWNKTLEYNENLDQIRSILDDVGYNKRRYLSNDLLGKILKKSPPASIEKKMEVTIKYYPHPNLIAEKTIKLKSSTILHKISMLLLSLSEEKNNLNPSLNQKNLKFNANQKIVERVAILLKYIDKHLTGINKTQKVGLAFRLLDLVSEEVEIQLPFYASDNTDRRFKKWWENHKKKLEQN